MHISRHISTTSKIVYDYLITITTLIHNFVEGKECNVDDIMESVFMKSIFLISLF